MIKINLDRLANKNKIEYLEQKYVKVLDRIIYSSSNFSTEQININL